MPRAGTVPLGLPVGMAKKGLGSNPRRGEQTPNVRPSLGTQTSRTFVSLRSESEPRVWPLPNRAPQLHLMFQ